MRRLSRKTIIAIVAMIMTLTASMGMTLAYFSDTDQAEGGAVLLLSGKTEIIETPEAGKKTISIKNISEDPVDMITRVKVVAPVEEVEFDVGSGWKKGSEGWWYYTTAIPKEGSTTPLVASWTIPANSVIENYDVIVLHESSPAVYNADGSINWSAAGWPGPSEG